MVVSVLGVMEWSGDAVKCAQIKPRGTFITQIHQGHLVAGHIGGVTGFH